MGVSGSGKTCIGELLAKRLSFEFTDADQYHSPANKEKMCLGIPLTDDDRRQWLNILAKHLTDWSNHCINGILACSALKEEYRKTLLANVSNYQILYLKGDYQLIAERLAKRKHEFMNPQLLLSQFNALEEPENAISLNIEFPPEKIVEQICQELKKTK